MRDVPKEVLDGKFRMIRLIGEGGMGAVYEAEHVTIGHKVAVKVLQPELLRNAEVVTRFQREAQIAGRLGHDNICEVFDVGTTPQGAPYLVMPLLRGVPLAELIRRLGRLPTKQSIDITNQVLKALSAAHNAGIVHRDLKPDNVFITRVGDRADFVKLLDFGISKILGDGPVAPTALTRTGSVMGTPYYMAPEQARGQKDQDHRVDLYAMGVILYEMLSGRRPFEGESFNDLLIKIVTEPFVPLRALREDIPLELDGLVQRAMSKDRDQRFEDATSMKEALSAARLAVDEPTGRIRITIGPTATDADLPPLADVPTPFGVAVPTGVQRTGRAFGGLVVGLAISAVGLAVAIIVLVWRGGFSATTPERPTRAPAVTSVAAPVALPPEPVAAPAPRLRSSTPWPVTPAVDAGTPRASKRIESRASRLIRGRGGSSVTTRNE